MVLAKTMLWVDFCLQTMFYEKCQFCHSERSFSSDDKCLEFRCFFLKIIWFFNISMTLVFLPKRNIIFVSCCDSCCSTFFLTASVVAYWQWYWSNACNGSRNATPTFYITTWHLCIWHLRCLASNDCNLSTSMMLVPLWTPRGTWQRTRKGAVGS